MLKINISWEANEVKAYGRIEKAIDSLIIDPEINKEKEQVKARRGKWGNIEVESEGMNLCLCLNETFVNSVTDIIVSTVDSLKPLVYMTKGLIYSFKDKWNSFIEEFKSETDHYDVVQFYIDHKKCFSILEVDEFGERRMVEAYHPSSIPYNKVKRVAKITESQCHTDNLETAKIIMCDAIKIFEKIRN